VNVVIVQPREERSAATVDLARTSDRRSDDHAVADPDVGQRSADLGPAQAQVCCHRSIVA
jgi:hypothetical protein